MKLSDTQAVTLFIESVERDLGSAVANEVRRMLDARDRDDVVMPWSIVETALAATDEEYRTEMGQLGALPFNSD